MCSRSWGMGNCVQLLLDSSSLLNKFTIMVQSLFEKFVTKKVVLILAAIATLLFLVMFFNGLSGLCTEYQPNCRDPYHYRALVIFWAPALLIVSLIVSSFEKKIFDFWAKFAVPWVILSSIVTYLIPFQENFDLPDWKGVSALCGTGFFLFVSLIIIALPSIQKSREKSK